MNTDTGHSKIQKIKTREYDKQKIRQKCSQTHMYYNRNKFRLLLELPLKV